mgnify:CR=1 FL=1|jgi:hypothetical protein|tara:strand:+ start:3199 stop:3636 length:438 start_codon:yes stop_codon:yes gene_type:complete
MGGNSRGFLLASFITSDDEGQLNNEVDFIVNNLNLTNKYIFLFRLLEEPTKKILTYNAIPQPGKHFNPRLYTMRVHRKKQTNTLYTINALNAAVAAQHDGAQGKNLKLNWDEYKNCLLLTEGKKLKVHPVEVLKIFKIEDPPEEN